ncbi:MAG: hypothetical protein K2X27_21495 [Candidatus Obscuribacterales bacterium]|nr:hypothetical protein [Candidatus Obscuribacterales bacterium]
MTEKLLKDDERLDEEAAAGDAGAASNALSHLQKELWAELLKPSSSAENQNRKHEEQEERAEEKWKAGDKVSPRDLQLLEELLKPDGVKALSTGDFLLREDGRESVYTAKGERVTVHPDGRYEIKGNVKSLETNKLGISTVTFKDGRSVVFSERGILEVSKGGLKEEIRSRFDPYELRLMLERKQ